MVILLQGPIDLSSACDDKSQMESHDHILIRQELRLTAGPGEVDLVPPTSQPNYGKDLLFVPGTDLQHERTRVSLQYILKYYYPYSTFSILGCWLNLILQINSKRQLLT